MNQHQYADALRALDGQELGAGIGCNCAVACLAKYKDPAAVERWRDQVSHPDFDIYTFVEAEYGVKVGPLCEINDLLVFSGDANEEVQAAVRAELHRQYEQACSTRELGFRAAPRE